MHLHMCDHAGLPLQHLAACPSSYSIFNMLCMSEGPHALAFALLRWYQHCTNLLQQLQQSQP
jgi:hypothetical protein